MSFADKLAADKARMAELIEAAGKAATAGEPIKVARSGLQGLINKADSNGEALASLLTSPETEKVALRFGYLMGEVRGLLADLSIGATDSDRSEGDSLSTRLQTMIDGAYVEGEDADALVELIGKWQASRPTKSSSSTGARTGEGGAASLGFTVAVSCVKCGSKVASTSKDNLNSLRDQVRKHHGDKHGGKFARGETLHTAVSDALGKVMKGESVAEDAHGDYTIAKVS